MKSPQTFGRLLLLIFSGSLAVQGLAFLRQLVVASAFGVDRAMDLYLLVFAVASMVVFGLGAVLENATVPTLVARIEANDQTGFQQIANRLFVLSLALSLAACTAFFIAVPLFARFVATGLSSVEQSTMTDMMGWFAPWLLFSVPFYACACILKSEKRFKRFLLAELLVTVASLVLVFLWHPHVGAIAVAYGFGYGLGLASMLMTLRLKPWAGAWREGTSWGLRRQITRIFSTNQVSTLASLADRFLQSHLAPGSISATTYSSLISGQISALLGFRDAFMVPLSQEQGRADKLERMLIGLIVLAVPVAFFLAAESRPVVALLLERGRFDKSAGDLAGLVLSYQAASIIPGVIGLPLFRMLQILDRMRFAAYILMAAGAWLLMAGSIMIFVYGMGIVGYTLATVFSAWMTMLTSALLVHCAGVRPRWMRVLAFGLFSCMACTIAVYCVSLLRPDYSPFWVLLQDGLVFSGVVMSFYAVIGHRLLGIVRGVAA
jgi:putative peptidoglycan lipid II flippase